MSRASFTRAWPLWVAALLLLLATAAAARTSAARNDGRFVYALDDTYIHLALAENVARHGVWGIDGREFASCSSSPLWTLLLAGLRFAGAGDLAAFFLATAFSLAVVVASYRLLGRHGLRGATALGVLVLAAAAAPLPTLAFVANEHALHALLTILLLGAAARAIAADEERRGDALPLAILGALVAASRYEGLFLIAVAAALLALRRRLRLALSLAGGGALAVAAFGLFSIVQGGYFLPNSVLMKAKYPWLGLGGKILAVLGPSIVSEVLKTPEVAALVAAAAVLLVVRLRARRPLFEEPNVLLVLFVAAALLHLDFARTGEFYRYEAYLVAAGVPVAAVAWAGPGGSPGRRAWGTLLAAAVALPLAWRAAVAFREIPVATGNIYQQQYQMARFVREHYAGEAVAANDIGAIDHLARIRCVDLWGLANMRVADARRKGTYGPETIREVAREGGAGIAMVYDRWFERFGGLPSDWEQIGRWTIENNVVCGSPTVSFYATSAASRERLVASLKRFSAGLPRAVAQSGAYLGEP